MNVVPEPKQSYKGSQAEMLCEIVISAEVVEKKLSKLNVNKSPGSDDFHPKFLYEIRKEISKPLADIYNLSLRQGIVPKDWKHTVVTPICKKGNKSRPQNYRPISLMKAFYVKCLESL